MTHASLFSGIGGFDLAAEWMGWENIFHCEWNPFGQKVLAHYFPNSKSYNDITKTDFSIHAGQIDILTGGFPCQPYSSAGKRLGKADERHLFPHMLRCIKEVKPKWVIGENVRGLVNWNGGMVFNEVCDDLEREGYEVQPFLIPAAGVNAPHQRQRIWFIAYSNGIERNEDVRFTNRKSNVINEISEKQNAANPISIRLEHGKKGGNIYKSTSKTQSKGSESSKSFETNGCNGNVTDTNNNGHTINTRKVEKTNGVSEINREKLCGREFNGTPTIQWYDANSNSEMFQHWDKHRKNGWDNKKVGIKSFNCTGKWETFPTQSPVCGGDDGISKQLDSITFSKWRKESIKAYGNAVVPQVVYEIFKAIQSFEDMV